MIEISDDEFEKLLAAAIDDLPKVHQDNLKNIAIIIDDYPTPEQRQKLALRRDQTLFGLYEGVPLPRRNGTTPLLPDKITIFRGPITAWTHNKQELKAQIRNTIWHEIAHYYGLDHGQIHGIEDRIYNE